MRQQIEREKLAEKECLARLPPQLRAEHKDKDMPEWWTHYNEENILKRQCGFWGEQVLRMGGANVLLVCC